MKRRGGRRTGRFSAIWLAMIFAGSLLRVHAAGRAEAARSAEEPVIEQAPSETGADFSETKEREQVFLDIDSHYKYEGMEQSFSEGYRPAAGNGVLHLVIPFTASGDLKGNRLTVSLVFSDGAASVLAPKNYQKTVEKKRYALKGGTMVCLGADSETGLSGVERETYLYCMDIPLSRGDAEGPCALTVEAAGYTEQMERVLFTRRIVFSLPEEGKPDGEDKTDGTEDGESNGEDEKEGEGNEKGDEKGDEKGNEEGSQGGEEGAGPDGSGGEMGGGSSFGAGGGEELIRQPKILLETDNLSGKELAAGGEEELKAAFRNCSASQSLYNLKVSASVEGSGLRLSKNSFYVAAAAPGESILLETGLSVAANAACGEHPVVFEFEYEDKKGNLLSGRETVVLSVRQPVELECLTGEIPQVLYASDTLELSLRACNVSLGQVFNVRASLSAEGLFPDGEVFVGNLEAGAAGEGTMRIYVGNRAMEGAGTDPGGSSGAKYGPVEGTVTFRYEDVDGKTYEETRAFRTEIKKAQILSFAAEEPEETNSWWVSVAAAAFGGLALWILLLLFRLRKKNKLLAEAGGKWE